MTEFIIFIVVIFLYALFKGFNKKSSHSTQPLLETDYSGYKPINVSTLIGDIEKTDELSFVLNPKCHQKLTLIGTDYDSVKKIRNILEEHFNEGIYYAEKELTQTLLTTGAECKEIKEYIQESIDKIATIFEGLKSKSIEWKNAGEKDKIDLEIEFKTKAMSELQIKPYAKLERLLLYKSDVFKVLVKYCNKFGVDNFITYITHAEDINKVSAVSADDPERKHYEELEKLGLFKRGSNIELKFILKLLKMKDINELYKDILDKPFTRKNEADEFALSQNKENLLLRLGKILSLRELFQAIPINIDNVSIENLNNTLSSTREISKLIILTFIHCFYSAHHKASNLENKHIYKEWQIDFIEDGCGYCKNKSKNIYDINNYPETPFHIGCRCGVRPIIKENLEDIL